MPLVTVVLTLIVVGVLLWLINTYIPMQSAIKSIINAVVVIAVAGRQVAGHKSTASRAEGSSVSLSSSLKWPLPCSTMIRAPRLAGKLDFAFSKGM